MAGGRFTQRRAEGSVQGARSGIGLRLRRIGEFRAKPALRAACKGSTAPQSSSGPVSISGCQGWGGKLKPGIFGCRLWAPVTCRELGLLHCHPQDHPGLGVSSQTCRPCWWIVLYHLINHREYCHEQVWGVAQLVFSLCSVAAEPRGQNRLMKWEEIRKGSIPVPFPFSPHALLHSALFMNKSCP